MKTILTIFFVIIRILGFGQTNPEDIILVYDSLNPNGTVILKSELVSDLDSLSRFLIDDMQEKLMTKKDSATIRNLLIGKWTLESVQRVNGIPFNLQAYEKMQYKIDDKFVLENPDDTVRGYWKVINERHGNLHLTYDEPQIAIKDKNILKLLPEEQIKSLTYSSGIKVIKEIDSKMLLLMTFIPENTENINDMFYRLILTTYRKNLINTSR